LTTAVLFTDLDRFKLVNDLYGHGVGDELLIAVARRLTGILRPGDTLARLSGDEFVTICQGLSDPPDITPISARLLRAFERPFHLSNTDVEITASVGVAFIGRGQRYSEEVLEEADAAMYQAKRDGGARHKVIDLAEQQLAGQRTRLEHDLHGAADRGELRNRYQPIVRTTDRRMVGCEALLRWDHPTCGVVLPGVVIPLAERAGLIGGIGTWVLEAALSAGRRWQQTGDGDHVVSVNVSATQIMSPGFAHTVGALLEDSGTEPQLLTLEVTETVFLQDSERAHIVLADLKRIGVNLALDDFGTGYSSLNYLRQYPIDIVKIDRGFVADLDGDTASDAIVFAVVQLAHLLGMEVIAEGVETREQLRLLSELDCDFCQGYLFARPLSTAVMDRLVAGTGPAGVVTLPSSLGGTTD
jgi:diguanylate cyclase (GGDEF)-like protein